MQDNLDFAQGQTRAVQWNATHSVVQFNWIQLGVHMVLELGIGWFSDSYGGVQPRLGVRFTVHVMHLALPGQDQNSITKLISSFTPHTAPFCMSATTMTFSFLICKAGRV